MPADRDAAYADATSEAFIDHNGEKRFTIGGPVPFDERNAHGAKVPRRHESDTGYRLLIGWHWRSAVNLSGSMQSPTVDASGLHTRHGFHAAAQLMHVCLFRRPCIVLRPGAPEAHHQSFFSAQSLPVRTPTP